MTAHSNAWPDATVSRLQSLLGPCVLLACKGKRPISKGWQKLALAQMTPAYLRSLAGNNIGVSLGQPSQGLVSIDFDTDAGLAEFLQLNPMLAATLRTRGQRGGNVWLRIIGDLPSSGKLHDDDGKPAGEWRSTGNQTIIAGIHPVTRKPYEIVVDNAPVEIEARALHWGAHAHPSGGSLTSPRPPCDTDATERHRDTDPHRTTETKIDSSVDLCASSPLYHAGTNAGALAALEAQRTFEQSSPRVARLYDRLVEHRFSAKKQGRNDFITMAVPFLFRALATTRVLEFSRQFYDRHQAVFRDPAEQHMHETQAMVEGVRRTYLDELPPVERRLYEQLSPREQDAYRICKDLALNNKNKDVPPPLFFLTCQDLGDRTDGNCEQGSRLLRKLTRLAIIAVHEAGSSHTKGLRGRATTYRWLLPSRS